MNINGNATIVMALTLAVGLLISCIGVWLYKNFAIQVGLIDCPNDRSLHHEPTPRGGGLVFLLIWIASLILFRVLGLWTWTDVSILGFGSLLVGAIGFWDDARSLSVKVRIVIHIFAAALSMVLLNTLVDDAFFLGLTTSIGVVIFFVLILMVVWSVNLFNFMDGLDGFAAVEAIFVFGMGGLFLWFSDAKVYAFSAWLLVSAVAGFLFWNWPKARVFMGDVGSGFLGFLIPIFALLGHVQYNVPFLLWVMIYGFFIFDATTTLLRRLMRRHPLHRAHRFHLYQRLRQVGWSSQKIIWLLILVNGMVSVLALCAYFMPKNLGWFAAIELLLLALIYVLLEKESPMQI